MNLGNNFEKFVEEVETGRFFNPDHDAANSLLLLIRICILSGIIILIHDSVERSKKTSLYLYQNSVRIILIVSVIFCCIATYFDFVDQYFYRNIIYCVVQINIMLLNASLIYFLNLSLKQKTPYFISIGTIIATIGIPILKVFGSYHIQDIYYVWCGILSIYTIALLFLLHDACKV